MTGVNLRKVANFRHHPTLTDKLRRRRRKRRREPASPKIGVRVGIQHIESRQVERLQHRQLVPVERNVQGDIFLVKRMTGRDRAFAVFATKILNRLVKSFDVEFADERPKVAADGAVGVGVAFEEGTQVRAQLDAVFLAVSLFQVVAPRNDRQFLFVRVERVERSDAAPNVLLDFAEIDRHHRRFVGEKRLDVLVKLRFHFGAVPSVRNVEEAFGRRRVQRIRVLPRGENVVARMGELVTVADDERLGGVAVERQLLRAKLGASLHYDAPGAEARIAVFVVNPSAHSGRFDVAQPGDKTIPVRLFANVPRPADVDDQPAEPALVAVIFDRLNIGQILPVNDLQRTKLARRRREIGEPIRAEERPVPLFERDRRPRRSPLVRRRNDRFDVAPRRSRRVRRLFARRRRRRFRRLHSVFSRPNRRENRRQNRRRNAAY